MTPYDRPPSAARVGARVTAEAADGASLRSRLVGTASRLITEGASRIFASFFHRRLAAPPAPPEENHQFRQEVPEATDINPSPERHEEGCSGDKHTKGSDVNISDTVGISEVEQLLKQKTFTRAEFDRLTKLLLSRTVESGALEPVIDIQNEDTPVLENRVEAPVLHENFSTDATNVTVAKDDLASPAELAKAYMGSIPSKVSPSSLILRSEVFHEDMTGPTNVPFISNPLKRSAVPRSVIQISGTPGFPENTYQTPKPQGRSNSPLSSSPYFKARPTSSVKGVGLAVVDYTGPSSSRLPPTNLTRLGGRQALKRRSSVLDTDSDSFGPIRRIRQKYYSTPPSRIRHSVLSNKVSYKGSSLKMPSSEELKHYNTSLLETENKENEIGSTSVPPVPPKSTETAMKILQQLDILVSPSKEKSSEPKSVAKDKSPSNLTHNVLGGWSPKNMEDSCNFGSNSSLHNFQSKKEYRVEENDPLQAAFSGGMLTSESCSTQNIALPPTDVNPVTKTVTFAISASAKFPPRQNTSFRMSAHKDASGSLSTKYEPETTKLKHSSAKSETVSPEKFLTSSSSVPGSSSLSLNDAGKKGSGNLGFSGKDTGFSVSVTSGLSTQSQQPPTPTMSGPAPDISALQKEQAVAPAFAFGSKAAPTPTPITASAGNTASQKVDARDATMTTAVEDTSSGKISEMSKPSNVSGNSVLSGISMKNSSGIFSFASSSATTTTQSNGSLYPASFSSPPSAGPAVTHSDTRASSPLSTTINTSPTSMSSPSIPYSAPIFSTVTSFKFGSSMSTDSTASANTGTTFASLAASSASPSMGSIFKFSASSQPTTSSFTDATNKSQSAATAAGSTQSTQLGPSSSLFGSFPSSSALGLARPSSGFGTSPFVFGPSATETSTVSSNPDTASSVVPAAATSLFNSSSQPFTSSVFGFTAGSSSPSPSIGSLFGNSSSATGSSSSPFSSSAIPVFSFTSAIPTTSPVAPVFGYGTGSPGNDKMNVENTSNAVNQTAAPTAAGQPSNLPTTPTFVFGSGTGGPQSPAVTPSQPFQAGNLGFAPGGGFSVGTGGGAGGGDKGGRRFIKIKRDKKPPRK